MFPFGRFGNFGEGFPYTNIHNLNQDWMIRIIKQIMTEYPNFVHEVEDAIKNSVPAPINDGAVGDFLMNLGNGQTQWSPIDPNIIYDAVNDWLIAHPEATTTVQDGSITPAKLDTELYNLYKKSGNVQFFFPQIPNSNDLPGASALMVTPHKTVLFDTNCTGNVNHVLDYYNQLFSAGIFTNIDYIILSHYHWDHVENLEAILQTFPHANCQMYIPLNPYGYYSATQEPALITHYNTVKQIAEYYGVSYTEVNTERTVDIDNLVSIRLLNSTPNSYAYYSNLEVAYNNYSMVALVKIGYCYAMFPGDLQHHGQERVYSTNDLPRLFLYAVHHHGIQNDDYIPYLKAIDPLYSVIPVSYGKMVSNGSGGSGASNMIDKICSGFLGSTAYSSYSFVCQNSSGIITHGIDCKQGSKSNTVVNYYVNNEYTGTIHEGTELHPFTNIAEATTFIKRNRNIEYNINIVKTNTPYEGSFIRDIDVTVRIQGVNNPTVKWLYIINCSHIQVRDMTITDGYPGVPSNGASSILCFYSSVLIKNVTMDGTAITEHGNALALARSKIVMHNTNISNYEKINAGYDVEFSEITCMTCTFSNMSIGFGIRLMKLYLLSGNTFTNVTQVIKGDIDAQIPFYARRGVMQNIYSLCDPVAISEPAYFTTTNCVMIIANSKIYNVLTGAEYTP